MPSARELLEQADAMMRRNRRERAVRAPPERPSAAPESVLDDPLQGFLPDVPLPGEGEGEVPDVSLVPTVILPGYDDAPVSVPAGIAAPAPLSVPALIARDVLAVPAPTGQADPTQGSGAPDPAWLDSLADLPILTDAVEVGALPAFAGSGAAPASAAFAPTVVVPPSEDAPTSSDPLPSAQAPAAGAEREHSAEWSSPADEIRAQVLQRLDLFTDTGLREQLGAHLQPIVERASAELVDTINRQVGEIVRSYVAEAIEREIEAWRNRSA